MYTKDEILALFKRMIGEAAAARAAQGLTTDLTDAGCLDEIARNASAFFLLDVEERLDALRDAWQG